MVLTLFRIRQNFEPRSLRILSIDLSFLYLASSRITTIVACYSKRSLLAYDEFYRRRSRSDNYTANDWRIEVTFSETKCRSNWEGIRKLFDNYLMIWQTVLQKLLTLRFTVCGSEISRRCVFISRDIFLFPPRSMTN